MKLTPLQWSAIGGAALLIVLIAFMCETRPPNHQTLEKSRALLAEVADSGVLLQAAKAQLDPQSQAQLEQLEAQVVQAPNDSLRALHMETVAGWWYQLGRADISGIYAERIAELRQDAPSWALAGTTFSICLQQPPQTDEKIRSFCRDHALAAFEKAISLDPQDLNSRVNLALVYVEMPPEDNPMKGIQMLLALNEQYPDEPAVLLQLARLAIRTGQYERAAQRLQRVLALAPDHPKANCLMAQLLEQTDRAAEAAPYAARCNTH